MKGWVVSFISSNTANIAPEKWCLGKDPFLLGFGLFSERTLSFKQGTWRIIPFRKWLIALISKSSNWGCSPSNNIYVGVTHLQILGWSSKDRPSQAIRVLQTSPSVIPRRVIRRVVFNDVGRELQGSFGRLVALLNGPEVAVDLRSCK